MKIKDLIAALSRLDGELEVFADDSIVDGVFTSYYDTRNEARIPCAELDLTPYMC